MRKEDDNTASVQIHRDLVKTLTDGMFKLMQDVGEIKSTLRDINREQAVAIENAIAKHVESCRSGKGTGLVSWAPVKNQPKIFTPQNIATAVMGLGLAAFLIAKTVMGF